MEKLEKIMVSLKSPGVKTVKQVIFINLNASPPNYFLIDHHPSFLFFCISFWNSAALL